MTELFNTGTKLSNKFTLYYTVGVGQGGKFINYYLNEDKFMQALDFGMNMEKFMKDHGVKWIKGYKFDTQLTAELVEALFNGDFRIDLGDTKHCTIPGYSTATLVNGRDYTKEQVTCH